MDIKDKKEEITEESGDQKDAYKNIFEKSKNNRIWSALSILAGALSVLLCFLPVLGVILSLFSIAFAVISRRVLGYFDGYAIAGLVIGVFGAVFGIVYSIIQSLFTSFVLF